MRLVHGGGGRGRRGLGRGSRGEEVWEVNVWEKEFWGIELWRKKVGMAYRIGTNKMNLLRHFEFKRFDLLSLQPEMSEREKGCTCDYDYLKQRR